MALEYRLRQNHGNDTRAKPLYIQWPDFPKQPLVGIRVVLLELLQQAFALPQPPSEDADQYPQGWLAVTSGDGDHPAKEGVKVKGDERAEAGDDAASEQSGAAAAKSMPLDEVGHWDLEHGDRRGDGGNAHQRKESGCQPGAGALHRVEQGRQYRKDQRVFREEAACIIENWNTSCVGDVHGGQDQKSR